MTPKMATLWKLAESVKVGHQLMNLERNPDADIRAKFKVDKTVTGTRAWAICCCIKMANPSINYTDDECDAITKALKS